jgi:hypothetical protein
MKIVRLFYSKEEIEGGLLLAFKIIVVCSR